MKVAVFGASVSAQTVQHDTDEVTGYSEVLRRRWLDAIGAASLKQICYAGGRLSDGGLYRVGHVIGHLPDLCLVEPLAEDTTRGKPVTEGEALFVYRSLLRRRILPVVVLLPDPAKRTPRAWDSYNLHRGLCARIGLPTVEVDLCALEDLSTHFVGLHTRLPGAQLYAETIAKAVQALGDRQSLAEAAFAAGNALPATLHETVVTTPPLSHARLVRLCVIPSAPGRYGFRVVQAQQVGPHSPMVEVAVECRSETRGDVLRSIWDPFCHYERPAFPVLDDRWVEQFGGPCSVTIKTSSIDPAYATARRDRRWPGPSERHLRPTGPIKVFSTVPVRVELLGYA